MTLGLTPRTHGRTEDLPWRVVAIPPFNTSGWLPEGIYDCTLEEATQQFGTFQRSDRRTQLWAKFLEFVREAKACGWIETIVVDGSFVTANPTPNDIDLILEVSAYTDFSGDLLPVHYNLLSARRVRKRFGFDIVVVKQGSENFDQAVAFFQQVRQRPAAKKGLIRIPL